MEIVIKKKKKKLNETYRMNNLTDYSVHNK